MSLLCLLVPTMCFFYLVHNEFPLHFHLQSQTSVLYIVLHIITNTPRVT
jgi:hypothetical protein